MRCLVLAEYLKEQEHKIAFACLPQEGDLIDVIRQRGFDVIELTRISSPLIPVDDKDYSAWLQRSATEDAHDFIDKVGDADVVISDHYAIGKSWQSIVRQALSCQIVAIDDLLREHDSELILDQTLGRQEDEYSPRKKVLAGTQYALLAADFGLFRELALDRVKSASRPKILVSMGGVDAPNASLKVLQALEHELDADITVLLSPRAPNYAKVQSWCSTRSNVNHIDFTREMAKLMLEHDIAIGAPGTTSWERACLGLPSVIIPLADNQREISEKLVEFGAAVLVDIVDISLNLASACRQVLNHWSQYHQVNLQLCDGRGTVRVAQEITLLSKGVPPVDYELVLANSDDIEQVYQWQRHPETRRFALNPEVPSWDIHVAWMSKKLNSAQDYFYMVKDRHHGDSVGVLRLDRMKIGHYLVSVFVSPDHYGRGVAYNALSMVDRIHPDVTLHATVLTLNMASQKLFEKANYRRVSDEEFIREPIE